MRIGEGGEEDVRDLEKELEEKRLAEEALEEGASQASTTDIANNNNNAINGNNNGRAIISSPMTSPMTSPVNSMRKSNQFSTNSSPIFPTDSINDNTNNNNRFNSNNDNRVTNNNLSFSPPLGRQSMGSNLSVSPLSTGLQMSPASVNQSPRTSAELQRRMSGSSHGSLYGEIDHGAGMMDEPMDSLDEETINAIDQMEQQAILNSPPAKKNNNSSSNSITKGLVIKEETFENLNDEEMAQEGTKTLLEIKAEDPEDVDQLPTQPMKGILYL